jgi:hypothetical protein
VTNDLVRRVYEHREKLADGFTKKYAVNRPVYFEQHSEIEFAIQREKRLKSGIVFGRSGSSRMAIRTGMTSTRVSHNRDHHCRPREGGDPVTAVNPDSEMPLLLDRPPSRAVTSVNVGD